MVIEDSAEHNGKEAYRCSICKYTFSEKRKAKAHVYVHTGEKQYECESCGIKYACGTAFKRHFELCKKLSDAQVPSLSAGKRVKYDTTPSLSDEGKIPLTKAFKCNICGQEFLEEETCKWHIGFCSENWKTKKVLETYLNSGDSWQCSFCGENFEDDQIYLSHSASCSETFKVPKHTEKSISEAETDIFKCELCGKVCQSKGVWTKHKNYCSSKLKTQQIVEDMLELNEEPSECYFCHEKFENDVECRNHVASCSETFKVPKHTEKSISEAETDIFKCELCGKVCKSKGILTKHKNYCRSNLKTQQIVEDMLELNEETFECFFCHEKFENEIECRNHLASCSQISNLKDELFSKTSSGKIGAGSKSSRAKIRAGSKSSPGKTGEFKCELCDKEFINASRLKRHSNFCSEKFKAQQIVEEMLKSNEKTFDCHFCNKEFADRADYIKHLASCSQTLKAQKSSHNKRVTLRTESFKCDICDQEFPNKTKLRGHTHFCREKFKAQQMVEEMLETNLTTFVCQFCNKEFANETDFMNHSISCDYNPEAQLAVEELLKLGQP